MQDQVAAQEKIIEVDYDHEQQNADLQHDFKQADAAQHIQKHVVIHTENDAQDGKKQQKKRPMTAQQKALYQKQQEFNSTTRWLADSAFTTYYGKPAFHAYGKGNTKPVNQNLKMMTHNINACTGK